MYTETAEGIEADWVFNGNGEIQQGTGRGVRTSKQTFDYKFEGEYTISYADQDGNKSPDLQLVISYHAGVYHLAWKMNDAITDLGIGMILNHKLIASYTKVM